MQVPQFFVRLEQTSLSILQEKLVNLSVTSTKYFKVVWDTRYWLVLWFDITSRQSFM